MEKFNKVVQTIEQSLKYNDPHGNMAFSVAFTDGSSGFFICKNQDLFFVGGEAEFYMGMVPGKSGAEYSKIKRVSAVEFDQPGKPLTAGTSESGSGKSKEVNDMINRSVAIKAVCELRSQSGTITIPMIIEQAEILFDYIQFGVNNGEPKDGPLKALEPVKPAKLIEQDDLPF